jgi:3-hydroxyacyl-CoA dehydrogenase
MKIAISEKRLSPYETELALAIANILSGGIGLNGKEVSEQYLLELEREAFLSQCGKKETLERLKYILSRKA